jgi:hypothetical protein
MPVYGGFLQYMQLKIVNPAGFWIGCSCFWKPKVGQEKMQKKKEG